MAPIITGNYVPTLAWIPCRDCGGEAMSGKLRCYICQTAHDNILDSVFRIEPEGFKEFWQTVNG